MSHPITTHEEDNELPEDVEEVELTADYTEPSNLKVNLI